jgi:hypothetical protein
VLRRKAGKAIRVPKAFMFLHEKFIALFSTPLQAINAAKIKGYLTFSGYFYPHDLQKTQKNKSPLSRVDYAAQTILKIDFRVAYRIGKSKNF